MRLWAVLELEEVGLSTADVIEGYIHHINITLKRKTMPTSQHARLSFRSRNPNPLPLKMQPQIFLTLARF